MTQNVERAKAILRIRKLSTQTVDSGCTEGQMNQAFEMIDRLMKQYNIDMTEVDVRGESCVQVEIDSKNKKNGPLDTVLVGVGKYLNLRVWRSVKNGTVHYSMFGLESDVMMGQYLMETVQRAAETAERVFMRSDVYNRPGPRGCKRSRLVSFRKGFARTIYFRFDELANARPIVDAGATDLVVVKGAYVEEEFAKIGMNLRKAPKQYYRTTTDFQSHGEGAIEGKNFNINRPIGNTSSTLALR